MWERSVAVIFASDSITDVRRKCSCRLSWCTRIDRCTSAVMLGWLGATETIIEFTLSKNGRLACGEVGKNPALAMQGLAQLKCSLTCDAFCLQNKR